jgi:hypothetical protein
MTDILDVIRKLKADLWQRYGNVLKKSYTQNEIHMTYYVSKVLEESGYELNSDYRYTEAATNAAFIAGLRIGQMDAKEQANAIVADRLEDAINVLKGTMPYR